MKAVFLVHHGGDGTKDNDYGERRDTNKINAVVGENVNRVPDAPIASDVPPSHFILPTYLWGETCELAVVTRTKVVPYIEISM